MQATGTCSASGQHPISMPTFQLRSSPQFVCCHLASSVSLLLLLIACQAHADVLTYPKLLLSKFPGSSHCLQCEVKCLPTMWKTWVQSMDREDLLVKEMATHSSILAWKIPWMEQPGRLQSMGSQSRIGLSDFTFFLSFTLPMATSLHLFFISQSPFYFLKDFLLASMTHHFPGFPPTLPLFLSHLYLI